MIHLKNYIERGLFTFSKIRRGRERGGELRGGEGKGEGRGERDSIRVSVKFILSWGTGLKKTKFEKFL